MPISMPTAKLPTAPPLGVPTGVIVTELIAPETEPAEAATVAVLEEGGYRTLNDIIDLDRDDLLRLPGIAPEEADRIMSIIDELTTEDDGEGDSTRGNS